MDWLSGFGYLGLFIGSFLAGTVVPFSSEILLIGMLAAGADTVTSVAVATAGNWIGGLTSYGIGLYSKWEWIERLHVSRKSLESQKRTIDRFGALIALFTWVPFLGNVFAVALGFYRVRFLPSAVWMFVGKCLRLIAWAAAYRYLV